MGRNLSVVVAPLALTLALGAGALVAGPARAPVTPPEASPASSTQSSGRSPDSRSGAAPSEGAAAATARSRTVLLVSVDGLNPDAVKRLGRSGAPHLTRLLAAGTGTSNARTATELHRTLPNHTGMVTGRRIAARTGGHGVTWNDDRRRPATVHAAAGERVSSIFEVVHRAGGSTALFAAKTKFSLWKRSWPKAIDRSATGMSDAKVVAKVRSDLRNRTRALRFVHLAAPDLVGHRDGFMSKPYLAAVRRTDRRLGTVLATLRDSPRTRDATVVLTSDHGGLGPSHDARRLANARVILVARGPGISRGADLYSTDPRLVSPGTRRPGYGTSRPPARNMAAGNIALQALGLGPVPGSEPEAAGPFDLTR